MCEQLMNTPLNPAVPFCLQLNEIADIGVRASVTLGQIDRICTYIQYIVQLRMCIFMWGTHFYEPDRQYNVMCCVLECVAMVETESVINQYILW